MKKFIIFILSGFIFGSELTNYLSKNYNELFDTELQKSFYESRYNSLSWISPIMLTYQRSWNNQIAGSWNPQSSFTISINQPIFKSGGIYYGIKFAKANYNLSKITILKQKNELIAKAIELLFKIKQTKLSIKKLKLLVKNSSIEVKSRKDLYKAGMNDSIELDQAISKKDEAQIALLEAQNSLIELTTAFKKISSKNPNNLKLPTLKLVEKSRFLNRNTDVAINRAKATAKEYEAKVTRSKYLPTVSLSASYTKLSDNPNPLFKKLYKNEFENYSINLSIPISINMGNDLEIAKLKSLIAKIEVKNSYNEAIEDYNNIVQKLNILNKKVRVSNKEANIYHRLYLNTKKLYKAGVKSIDDVKVFKNNYLIKKLEVKIYNIQKQIELLKLYSKMY